MSTSLVRTSVFRFPLDIHQSQSQVSVTAGLHEDGIRLVIRLMENGAPFDIHHAARAEFSAVRPDGKSIMNPCMIFGQGTVVYDFTGEEVLHPGVMPCQIFLYNPDGGLILSPKFHIVVHENAAADGEEVGAQEQYKTLKKFVEEISAVQNVLGTLHEEIYGDLDPNFNYNKDHPYDPNYEINNYHSRIDVLEAARPVTGEITINTSEWNKIEGGYSVLKKLATDVVREGDVILIIPDDDASRVASADVAVRVNSLVYEQTLEDVLVFMSALEPKVDLCYRYIVVRRGADDENTQANAIIIGVNDVPQYVKDKISLLETWKEMAAVDISKNAKDVAANTTAIEALRETVANLDASAGLTPEQVQDIVAEALPKAPTSIDLTALDPVEQEDGRLMGYIVETFGEEDGAPTETTELTYDDAGNIVSIKTADGHVTELKWKEAE